MGGVFLNVHPHLIQVGFYVSCDGSEQTFSITGRSSSASMGTLVLVTQVLVQRCRSLT